MSARRGLRRGRRAPACRCVAAAAVVVWLVVGGAAPAAAAPSAEAPTTMALGETYRLTGSGWPEGNQCSVMLQGGGAEIPTTFDTCSIAPGGILDHWFTVPGDLPPGPHLLWVDACPGGPALSESCSWNQAVDIVPSDTPPPPPEPPPPPPPPPDVTESTIELSPNTGPPGTTVAVTGAGFVPSTCTVGMLGTPGTCTVDGDGALAGTVVVPRSALPGPATVTVCTGCGTPAVALPRYSLAMATFVVTPLDVTAGHDLAVTSVAVAWTDRGAIVVDATVENLGGADAPAATIEAGADGWATRERALATLAAAARQAVRLTLSPEDGAEPGRHLVTVTVVQDEPDGDPGNDTSEATVEVPEAALPPDGGSGPGTPGDGEEEEEPGDRDGDGVPDEPGDPPADDTPDGTTGGTGGGPATSAGTEVAGDPVADDGTEPWAPLTAVVVVLAIAGAAAASTLVHRRRVRRRSLAAGAPPGTIPETVASSTGPRPALAPASGRAVRLTITTDAPTPRPHDPMRPLRRGTAYRLGVEVPPPGGPTAGRTGGALGVVVFAAAGADVDPPFREPVEVGGPGTTGPAAFAFTVSPGARRVALRCNLYRDGTLVQARLVTGRVRRLLPGRGGVRAVVDYTSVPSLDEGRLAAVGRTDLSLLVNRARPGTVQVYAAGGDTFAGATSLDAGAVGDAVSLMRRALHTAAWGDDEDWTPDKADRYDPRVVDEATRRERLRRDLVAMAKTGYDLYDAVIGPLAGGTADADRLTAMVRRPAYVEVAHKVSPRLVLPAALLYDHPLDAALPVDRYGVCPAFLADLDARRPLDGTACVDGRCPSHGDLETVCPSGFWGFRHFLGTPVSVADGPDAPAAIEYDGGPTLAVAVSTDLELRAGHEGALRALVPPERLRYADERDAVFDVLGRGDAQVAYFYCHGGIAARGVPYIQVGPAGAPGITRSLLRAKRLRWTDPRPLVVLNGCRTAALTPDRAIDLVSGFVDTAGAAGVMGTEVTVFEPLAGTFAVELLRRLLAGDELGRAVRDARLALLRGGNPLGLVYVTYAAPRLRLAARAPRAAGAAAVTAGGAG